MVKINIVYLSMMILLILALVFSLNNANVPVNYSLLIDENGNTAVSQYGDINTITFKEKYLFNGQQYLYSDEATIDAGSSLNFYVCTNSNATIFVTDIDIQFESSPVQQQFYEDPIMIDNGTLVTSIVNTNRNYNITEPGLVVYKDGTVSDPGTLIFKSTTYGGNRVEGTDIIHSDIVLKKGSCYLLQIYNLNSNANDLTFNFLWHKEEN